MRKILAITILMAAVMVAFALQVTYTNSSGADVFVEGRWVEAGDTVIFDHYVYNDALTFTSATADDIIFANEVVSTTDAATTTVTFTRLADVELEFDYDSGNKSNVTLYFNETDTTSLTLDSSWTYAFNTGYVYRLYFVTAQSTTAVSDENVTGSTTSWTLSKTPIVEGSTLITLAGGATGTDTGGVITYSDASTGTISYTTGAITSSSVATVTASYNYYDEMNYTVTVKEVF